MPFITQGRTNIVYILIVVVLAIIVGGSIFWYSTRQEVPYQSPGVQGPAEIDETAGWQTYKNEELGINFKYPPDFGEIVFGKSTNAIKGWPGVVFTSQEPDQNQMFYFSIYSKDYKPFGYAILNQEPVNVNWSAPEFATNMGLSEDRVYFVKKLSPKSMLVALYQSEECSPYFDLGVLTPLNENYPNLEIKIGFPFHDDPLIKEYQKSQLEKGLDPCDQLEVYRTIAEKIYGNAYSDELNSYIETARLIADSVMLIRDETADWQTYTNKEHEFEIKYPEGWQVADSGSRIENQLSNSYLGILKNNNEKGLTLDEWFKETTIVNGRPTLKAAAEKIFINDIEAYRLNSDLESPNPLFEIVGIANARREIFTIYAYSNQLDDNTTLEQMLSTFNFIGGGAAFTDFRPLESPSSPPFIQPVKIAQDIKIDLSYEGEYSSFSWPEPEFYIPEDSNEKFIFLSKSKREPGQYIYGPEHYSVFSAQGSHWYGGSPIYLLNPESEYTVSFIGLNINNRDLVSELKVEFGIDFGFSGLPSTYLGKSEPSILDSILGIEPVYACGPGLALRPVGDSNLNIVGESGGVTWYRLEEPVALYDLRLSYCDADCSNLPDCPDWAEPPPGCEDYPWCCHWNASISNLEDGNLKMHILYKPNNQEGFLKLQLANLILTDSSGAYYQPVMGENFNHYYRAYFQ